MNSEDTVVITAWVESDEDLDSGGTMLLGDREGLAALRDAIDLAISNGEASITAKAVEFSRVRRVDEIRKSEPQSFLSSLAGTGCFILLLICVFIFLFGIWQLKSLIFAAGTHSIS